MHIQHTALATAATTASLVACTITKIQGLKVAANDRFLQLHDTKATPAATAVPVRVWPIYGTAPFGEAFINLPVALTYGATFVVSTTANTYTATAETVDITVDGNAVFDSTGVSYAGDYTTGDEVLQVWADSAGPKALLRLEITDDQFSGGTWIQVHCSDTPATDKIVQSIWLADGATVDLFFGGLVPFKVIGDTIFDGCTIAMSSDALTYVAVGLSNFFIKATYK